MDDECEECGCGRGSRNGRCCSLGALFVFAVLFMASWDTLEPTEYGIVQNGITGSVDLDPDHVYEGGRYFIWLRHYFLVFPRNLCNLDFQAGGFRPQIPARTGPDPDDRESGGQPVTLSIAFQYKLQRHAVPKIYQTFGMAWEASYMRFAQQAVTNVAQQFTPKMFWDDRTRVERAFHHAINQSLVTQGFAEVINLQLLKVGFKDNYETTITNIQLQEQLKVTKNYQLEVTRVLKEVDIMQSQTEAAIALINAEAKREAAVILNQATTNALQLEQQTKATWYATLKAHMGWDNAAFLKYVKMKSLNAQPSDSMVVGVSAVGS
jgi:hypothetical protein